jgi:hypothetical protein
MTRYDARMQLKRADLRAYLDRPWDVLEAATAEHRAAHARRDPEWAWQMAASLRRDVVEANPRWPAAADRKRDLDHHLHLKQLLDRASDALGRRHRST